MKDFLIPLGIDSEGFNKGINDLISKIDRLIDESDKANTKLSNGINVAENSTKNLNESLNKTNKNFKDFGDAGKQSGDKVSKSLNDTAKEADKFNESLKQFDKSFESIREQGKQFGRQLADSLNDIEIDELTESVKAEIQQLGAELQNADLNIDTGSFEQFNRKVKESKDLVEVLREYLKFLEKQLNSVGKSDPRFQQLSEDVEYARGMLDEFTLALNESENANKSLESRIDDLKQSLYRMRLEGDQNTKTYSKIKNELSELQGVVKDVDEELELALSKTPVIDNLFMHVEGLVGVFATLQSSMALLTDDNEKYEKVTKNLMATLTLLQGLQSNLIFLQKLRQNNIKKLIFLRNLSIKQVRGYAVALKAEAQALTLSTVATKASTLAVKAFRLALASIGIGLIVAGLAYLVANWDKLTKAVNDFLPAGTSVGKIFDELEAQLMGVGKAVVNYVVAPFKLAYDILTGQDWDKAFDNLMDNLNVVENYSTGAEETRLKNRENHLNESAKQSIEHAKRELEIMKARNANNKKELEKIYELERSLNKSLIIAKQELGEEVEDLLYNERMREAQHFAEKERQRKEDLEKEKQKREERRKQIEQENKRLEELLKKQRKQIYDLDSQIDDIENNRIKNKYDRQIAILKTANKRKIKAIEDDTALTAEAKEKQKELIKKIKEDEKNEVIQIEKEKQEEVLKLQQDFFDDRLKYLEDTETVEILRIYNQSDKEIEAIKEKYKDQADTIAEMIQLVEDARDKKIKEVQSKYNQQKLKDEEERAKLLVELAYGEGEHSVKAEQQKQLAILEIRKEYAEKRLEQLREDGKTENSLVVLQAKQLIQEISAELEKAKENGGGFDLYEFMGLGELSSEQRDNVQKAVESTLKNLSQITDFVVEQYDRQIQKRQQNIESINNEMSEIEAKLQNEQELREAGLANNASALEQELQMLKEQKEEEQRLQNEALEKKKKAQKAQIIIDSVTQVSNLITSSTEIFKALSGIPFIGVPLAIATIATMFGAFASAKIKAFQNVNAQTTQFKKGGKISGKPHEQGGIKFYSTEDTNIVELEGDEFIVNKTSTKKHEKLLEAINEDRLLDLGILTPGNAEGNQTINIDSNTSTLDEINTSIKKISNKEQVIKSGDYIIIKKGNTTRKVKA